MSDRKMEEDLLERLFAGDLDEDSEEWIRAIERNPGLLDEVDGLRRLQAELDASSVRARVLSEAADVDWEAGDDRLFKVLAENRPAPWVQGEGPPDPEPSDGGPDGGERRTPRHRHPSGLGLLAILLSAAAVVLLLPTTPPDIDGPAVGQATGPVFLGDELPGATPAGEVEGYARFQWSYELPPGWSFELRVFDATEGASGEPLAEPLPLRRPEWEAPAEARTWPDAIRWTVQLVRPDGTRLEGYTVRAWRPRR